MIKNPPQWTVEITKKFGTDEDQLDVKCVVRTISSGYFQGRYQPRI